MSRKVLETYKKHKAMFDHWEYGEPVKSWTDSNRNLCIQYQSGKWFHYRQSNGILEFW